MCYDIQRAVVARLVAGFSPSRCPLLTAVVIATGGQKIFPFLRVGGEKARLTPPGNGGLIRTGGPLRRCDAERRCTRLSRDVQPNDEVEGAIGEPTAKAALMPRPYSELRTPSGETWQRYGRYSTSRMCQGPRT